MTMVAARIWGRRLRLRQIYDDPKELETSEEASEEKDDSEKSTITTEAYAEELEETTLLR